MSFQEKCDNTSCFLAHDTHPSHLFLNNSCLAPGQEFKQPGHKSKYIQMVFMNSKTSQVLFTFLSSNKWNSSFSRRPSAVAPLLCTHLPCKKKVRKFENSNKLFHTSIMSNAVLFPKQQDSLQKTLQRHVQQKNQLIMVLVGGLGF